MSEITVDEAHVLLDALLSLRVRMDKGELPWADYDGEVKDPKLTRDGFTGLMQSACTKLESIVENG